LGEIEGRGKDEIWDGEKKDFAQTAHQQEQDP
jgi:hypothetical protein